MRKLGFTLILTAITLSAGSMATYVRAEDKPTTQPSADATVIAPKDKAAIAANMDKDVVIEGVIEKAEWSSTGKVMRASFKDAGESKLQAIIFEKAREKFDAAYSGDVSKALTGAKVKLKGKLKDYKGEPEIVLDEPAQITLVDGATTAPATGAK